ncbi:MAG: M23 family metallopeptidase [Granulosicoccus sp.]
MTNSYGIPSIAITAFAILVVMLPGSLVAQFSPCKTAAKTIYDECLKTEGGSRTVCLRHYDDTMNSCQPGLSSGKSAKSKNVYRIPYADGTNVHISRDFYDHNPQGRVDMWAKGAGTHRVVAAASGTVMAIEDSRSKQQVPINWLRNTADCLNNFIWIEHENREWSKYSHLRFGTTTTKAKLKVGDRVSTGQYLGDEGKVGCAWPAHLHFQIVQVKEDSSPRIDPVSGALRGYEFSDERNPRFSDLTGKIFTLKDGENYVAGGLPSCRKDTECPSDHYCNAGLDLSANRCVPLKSNNESCELAGGSRQCASGYCQFGRCYTPQSVPEGGTCYVNKACKSGKCSDVQGLKGRCVCKKDLDCESGHYCDAGLDLNLNSCKALKRDNEACDLVGGGHQCISGFCKYSKCYTPGSVASGGTCYNDDACKVGKCSAVDGAKGSCVCKKDNDCGKGKWCDKGLDFKVNACRNKLGKGQSCGKTGTFGNDRKCKSGKCSGFPKYICK